MNRILGLDVGSKVIGVALTDETQTIVTPHAPIIRSNAGLRLGAFKKLIDTFKIKTVVVGLPLYLDGSTSEQTSKTKAFVKKLQKHFPTITFITVDERLSTESVKQKYQQLKLHKKKSTPKAGHRFDASINIDSFSAMEILENFLANRK